jgi:hypothetical protein
LVPQKEISGTAHYPEGAARLREAAKLATRLVLKLGSPRARFAAQNVHRATGAALWTVWLLGWGLLAALAAVVAASFPGLNFLKAAL